MSPSDWLDPEDEYPKRCISCECPWDDAAPEADCPTVQCPCHAVYWMTVPENEKRAMWGDR